MLKPKFQYFVFEDWEFKKEIGQLRLHYNYDGQLHFTHSYSFNFPIKAPAGFESTAWWAQAVQLLFILSGISYYKAYLAPSLRIKKGSLNRARADFFEKVYREGLGQFWYENQLDIPDNIGFPVDSNKETSAVELSLEGTLLPIGGGKDSLLSAELLAERNISFASWMVNHTEKFSGLFKKLRAPHLAVTARLDRQLLDHNRRGAYNGHIPITAVNSALSVVVALLTGKKRLVFSCEASANSENIIYQGMLINHQYSKSLAFERLLADYLKNHISPKLEYFSLLRPFSELRIAELFVKKGVFDKYYGQFSSCNRNFVIANARPLGWCGECPKCAFAYLIFAPFVTRRRLDKLFGGKGLFSQPGLKKTYLELFGKIGHKPFDCVGEIPEAQQAGWLALQSGGYPELGPFNLKQPNYDYNSLRADNLPSEFAFVRNISG